MGERINIQNLIDLFAEKKGISKKDAENFLKEFFALIEQVLETDKYVKIKSFGTFKLIDVDSRESVNVNTGERIEIQGHTKISFTPEASLRDQINKPFSHFETVILNDGVDFEGMSVSDENADNENESGVSIEEEDIIDSNNEDNEVANSSLQIDEAENVQPKIADIKEESIIPSENVDTVNVDKPQNVIETVEDTSVQNTEINEENTTLSEDVEKVDAEISQKTIETNDVPAQNTEIQEEELTLKTEEDVTTDEPVIAAAAEKIVILKSKKESVSLQSDTEVPEGPQAPATLAEFISQTLEIKSKQNISGNVQKAEKVKEDLLRKSEESLAVVPKEMPVAKTEEETAPKQSGALIEELILRAKADKAEQEAIVSNQNTKTTIYYFVAMVAFLAVFAVAVFTYIYNPEFVMSMVPASSETTAADSVKVDSVPVNEEPAIAMVDTVPTPSQKKMDRLTEIEAKNAEAEAKKAIAEAEKALAKSKKKEIDPVVAKEPAKEKVKSETSDSKEKKKLEKLDPNNYTIVGTKSTYTVKKGESLVRISQQFYNSKDLWTLIVKHNQKAIKDPDNVPAGTVLKIPNLHSKK